MKAAGAVEKTIKKDKKEKKEVVKMSQEEMDADLDSYIKGRAAGGEAAEAAEAAAPAEA